jgi:hypothetical protein
MHLRAHDCIDIGQGGKMLTVSKGCVDMFALLHANVFRHEDKSPSTLKLKPNQIAGTSCNDGKLNQVPFVAIEELGIL